MDFVMFLLAAGLAQSVDCLTAEREVAGSVSGARRILRVLKWMRNEGTAFALAQFKNYVYYMAMSQKDWKQKNSRIWLAKIDFDRGLDFPI